MAMKAALELYLEASWSGVAGLIFEVDSHLVMKWLNVPALQPWRWWPLLASIYLLMKKVSNVQLCYVNRSSNSLVEGLAKDGFQQGRLVGKPNNDLEFEEGFGGPCGILVSPTFGCFKFNVSGTYKDHKASCGRILRIEEGILRALFLGPIEGSCIYFAKLVAIKVVLELYLGANWSGVAGVIFEVDSHSVLKWLNILALRPWRWWPLLVSIDLLMKNVPNAQLCYVNKISNSLAEGLAKDGVSRATFFKAWW
ncbi:hypothetical protein V6N11_058244 [Hibiscus sabdariffa]